MTVLGWSTDIQPSSSTLELGYSVHVMMACQGSATKPFSERLKELKSGRCHVGAAVAEEILRNSVGDIPSLLRDGYTVILYYIIYILQKEQSLCFLEALQNIHFGQLRITSSSPFCVPGVGRSIITLF